MTDTFKHYMQKTLPEPDMELFGSLFGDLPAERFAVIKVSGQTLDSHIQTIVDDIAFLNGQGLYPILVHGAGTALDAALPHSKKVDGVRVTTAEDMHIIKEVFYSINLKVCEGILNAGGKAENVTGIFGCTKRERYGEVGEVVHVDVSPIQEAISRGATPVVSPVGWCGDDPVNINADTAARGLVRAVHPRKYIMLTETGGILDGNGKVIPYVDLSNDSLAGIISGGMLVKVNEATAVLKDVPSCSVSITGAPRLLKEVFTVKGSGTYLKYHAILSTMSPAPGLLEGLVDLVEGTFGKTCVQTSGPGGLSSGILEVIYQKDLEGAAIIKEVAGVPYLDKFAVATPYQGTGLGASLWQAVSSKYPDLLWRAAPENPCNSFYSKTCGGMVKYPDWTVYWTGLEGQEAIRKAGTVAGLPASLIPARPEKPGGSEHHPTGGVLDG